MNGTRAYKNLKKQQDRAATIKHYLLGFLLECIENRDIRLIIEMNEFIVNELNVIDEISFDKCVFKLAFSEVLSDRNTRENYRRIKSQMKIKVCDMEEQLRVINSLKAYADSYQKGKYISARMIESSYL